MRFASESVVTEIPGLADILAGSESGWDTFYQHYLPIVTQQVNRAGIVSTLNGGVKSEDVAHDIIAKMATNGGDSLKGLENRTHQGMTAYFKMSVKNLHTDIYRTQTKFNLDWGFEIKPQTDEQGRDNYKFDHVIKGYIQAWIRRPDEAYEAKETAGILYETLEELSPQYKTIIEMLICGCPQKEIASELDVNIKSVGSLVRRAKEQLKKLLLEKYPDHFEDKA